MTGIDSTSTVVSAAMITEIDRHLSGRRGQLRVKRAIDGAVALLLLFLLLPLLTLTALAIRLDSPGPVLFGQLRWGKDGKLFRCLKFRSMVVDPDRLLPAGQAQRHGRLLKMKRDPRVTRVGRFLRRTSLDELPQLLNVLRGEMSLVGPRPLMVHMLEPYPQLRRVRGRLRPGITGLWQVNDRGNNTHVASMARYDLDYLRRMSLALDLGILIRTVRVVVSGQGAV